MSYYKDCHSLFYNVNEYIDTYVIHKCIGSLHTSLAMKEYYYQINISHI